MKKILILACLTIGVALSVPSYAAVTDVDYSDAVVVVDDVDTADALVVSTALTTDLTYAYVCGDIVEAVIVYAVVVEKVDVDLDIYCGDYDVGTPKDTYYLRKGDIVTYKDLPLLVPLSL